MKISVASFFLSLSLLSATTFANPLKPLPPPVAANPNSVALGASIFESPNFSDNGFSCASCHNLATAGSDKLPLAAMSDGSSTVLRTLSIYNVSHNKYFGWSGQKKTLDDFLVYHLDEEKVFNGDMKSFFAKASSSQALMSASGKSALQQADLIGGLVAYLSGLNTSSRFDKYLNGDESALTTSEKNGYKLFQSFGCNDCHFGVNFGAATVDSMGMMRRYFNRDTPIFYVNKNNGKSYTARLQFDPNSSVHALRPGVLRNIANRAPFFHDGSAETLKDAVSVMLKYQIGRSATDEEKNELIDFIKSLASDR